MSGGKKTQSKLCLDRLYKALYYLELTRLSRVLAYGAISPVVASENLIKIAIEKQRDAQDNLP